MPKHVLACSQTFRNIGTDSEMDEELKTKNKMSGVKGVLLTPISPQLLTKRMSLAMYPWLTILHLIDNNNFLFGKLP